MSSDERSTALSPDFDFPAADGFACPYPIFRALRTEQPVRKLPGRDEFLITSREDIHWVTRHPELFSSRHSVFQDGLMRAGTLADIGPDRPAGIGRCDPPQHAPKRRLAFELFKPGKLRGYEGMIRGHVDTLIDGFVADGHCEFVARVADPLPVMVILSLFGLSAQDHELVRAWGRYEGAGSRFTSPERQESARQSRQGLGSYMRDALVSRHEHPRDDELSRFVRLHVEHYGALDLANIVPDATTLMIGGIFTTTHLLSNMLMLLLQHPVQLARVREDRSLLGRAIEEALRCEAPVQWSPRLVLEDVELGGVPIPAGAMLMLAWASANHDDSVFPDDERFDVGRENAREHMAFGDGIHFCLGAPLARLEARVAFEQLLERLPGLRAAAGNDFAFLETPLFRGPKRLEIEFGV